MNNADILVIGEALVDIVHRANGRVDETPGGSPANVALALARLGGSPQLLTQLGDDRHGRKIRDWLDDSGVKLLTAPSSRTATATAHLDAQGSASYEFDIDWALPTGGAIHAAHQSIVHTGSIATFLSPGANVVHDILTQARGTALITYDPNVRPALLPDRKHAQRSAESFVALADLVKASDEDLAWLYPGVHPFDSARKWLTRGPAVVVVTMGADGAVGVTAEGMARVGGERVEVIDTVGAGDTFMSALIHGLIELGYNGADARERLREIDSASLLSLLALGVQAAAITVSRPGADPPHRGDLLVLRG